MERIKINQWAVTVGVRTEAMFTPRACDAMTAMAIAVSTFGAEVSAIVDEGLIKIDLTNKQASIADPRICAECGEWNHFHDGTCSQVSKCIGGNPADNGVCDVPGCICIGEAVAE